MKNTRTACARRCVAVADALLRETELSSPPRARPAPAPARARAPGRLLLRPLLGFCSPREPLGLAAMLAVEDDVAAAGGGA